MAYQKPDATPSPAFQDAYIRLGVAMLNHAAKEALVDGDIDAALWLRSALAAWICSSAELDYRQIIRAVERKFTPKQVKRQNLWVYSLDWPVGVAVG